MIWNETLDTFHQAYASAVLADSGVQQQAQAVGFKKY